MLAAALTSISAAVPFADLAALLFVNAGAAQALAIASVPVGCVLDNAFKNVCALGTRTDS
jgi:hypothetical protein